MKLTKRQIATILKQAYADTALWDMLKQREVEYERLNQAAEDHHRAIDAAIQQLVKQRYGPDDPDEYSYMLLLWSLHGSLREQLGLPD